MGEWLSAHGFDVLQSAGIIAAFALNVTELRQQKAARRLANLSALIQQHRDIWRDFAQNPALARVKRREVDLTRNPLSREEATFVRFVIAHLLGAYEAARLKEIVGLERLSADAAEFLSFPVPQAVWNEVKGVHDQRFVEFVEEALQQRT